MSSRGLAFWLLLILVAVLLLDSPQLWHSAKTIDYSEFLDQLAAGNVRDLDVGDKLIRGELAQASGEGSSRFVTKRVEPALVTVLQGRGVPYRAVPDGVVPVALLGWLLPLVLMVLVWQFIAKRSAMGSGMGAGLMSIGRSKARVYMETGIRISFDDVAGVDEAKEELREVVGFLKDPKRHGRLGARVPHGILLVGPPGTGKTLLARAVAGEAAVPFFSINGSEFVEMFVGVGAARVRDLFEQARQKAPAIVFIDEIDARGRARGALGLGGHDEKEQTLNQLLAELDGFDPASGIVLLAATNRPEILDPALLRAGRFDRQVLVDRPDRIGRVQILKVHLRKVTLEQGVDPDEIAALTPGFSGADLANLVNEAALLATRRDHAAVTLDDVTGALERIVAGLEKRNRLLNPAERKTVAFHEMGHALVAMSVPSGETVHKVSIIPRGVGALGYTIQRPTEDRFLMTRAELRDKMTVLLGGRAAEQLCLGEISTGAADDLTKATRIARSMVMQYGMDPVLGAQAFDAPDLSGLSFALPQESPAHPSDATFREIDCAVRALIDQALIRSGQILAAQRGRLERGAQRLLRSETLSHADLVSIFAEPADPDPATIDPRAQALLAGDRRHDVAPQG